MQTTKIYLFLFLLSILISCEKSEIEPTTELKSNHFQQELATNHPNAEKYQEILDRNQKLGIVGATLMIKDQYGEWLGASGKADLETNADVVPDDLFLIASISKVFTATAIFSYIDKGILSLDDPISKWIDQSIIKKIKNANQCQIKHLLAHTSGLADYYTVQYELDRMNKKYNNWLQEDVLAYTYGKKPTNNVGETYYYSNTNFLLLGMIVENASGLSLSKAYQENIFNPINLTSAKYQIENAIPAGTVKGYVDMFGNGTYVDSEFLYKDELRTGDGGIAINAYDLGIFFEQLMKGELISSGSLAEMTNWFDLPEDWVDDNIGHFQNGYGLEYNKTPYGNSVGHTGGIDGFLSIAQYFPEQDATFILLTNSASYNGTPRLNIYNECLKLMFEDE